MAIDSGKIEFIQLDCLRFDNQNPRLPRSLEKDERSVLQWMLQRESVTDLMSSIGAKGFFPGEPLLVIPNKDKTYTVIEGNRRYTASLLLSHPDLAPIQKNSVTTISRESTHHPEKLPCLTFENRDAILDYLGYRHITGVEAWDALAKARYLRQLSNRIDIKDFKKKCKSLAAQIGSTPQYVKQLLLGIELFDYIENANFFNIKGLDDQTFEFGTFYTAIGRTNIASYIGIDLEHINPTHNLQKDNLSELVHWIFEKNAENQTRIGESRNLSKLDKILDPKYKAALQSFKEGSSLSAAINLTDDADSIVLRQLGSASQSVDLAWTRLPYVKDYSKIDKQIILNINSTLKNIHALLLTKTDDKSLDL